MATLIDGAAPRTSATPFSTPNKCGQKGAQAGVTGTLDTTSGDSPGYKEDHAAKKARTSSWEGILQRRCRQGGPRLNTQSSRME
ncbi:hypothetical protein ETB97_005661 [Aspergillus alliaceus]|uniref:Uncharacterized protein n=1 Tax=Petromyces alliaceus TaxID=209559 RepID=A0A8H5ZVD6_PETAA|nr:hypothetical protein ETB97_005661 [Aspergillus burnettii]